MEVGNSGIILPRNDPNEILRDLQNASYKAIL